MSLLDRANHLLGECGRSTEDVRDVQRGSLFVFLFETLFERKLRGVVRTPRTAEDYAWNIDCVLTGMNPLFAGDLRDQIYAPGVVAGDESEMDKLLQAFETVLFQEEAEEEAGEYDDDDSDDEEASMDDDDDDSFFSDSSFGDASESDSDSAWGSLVEEKAPPPTRPRPSSSSPAPSLPVLTWEQRVERLRLQRMEEDLLRAVESQRLDRLDADCRLTRELVQRALQQERERIAVETRALREKRALADDQHRTAVEAAAQVYRNKRDLLQEHLLRQQRALVQEQRNYGEELRRMKQEWKAQLARDVRAQQVAQQHTHERAKLANERRLRDLASEMNMYS